MDDNQQQQSTLTSQEPGQQQSADTLTGQQQTSEPQAQGTQQQQQSANPTEPQQGQTQQGQNPAAADPVTYDFSKVQMPEGYTLSEEESKQFVDVIKDMGLNNEQAGAIVKYGTEYGKRLVDAVVKEHDDMIKEWGEKAKTELGADLQKHLGYAAVARDKFPGLKEALDETGAGNRVEVIKAMSKLGELLSSDPGMVPNAGTQRSNVDPMNDAKTLYPNTDFSRYR